MTAKGVKKTRILACVQGPYCSQLQPPKNPQAVVECLVAHIALKGADEDFELMPGGCLGICGKGPNLRIFSEGDRFAYCGVSPEDAAVIVDAHHNGDEPVERLLYRPC